MHKFFFVMLEIGMGLVTKTKMKAKEELPVAKWPQIFDRTNPLCPRIRT